MNQRTIILSVVGGTGAATAGWIVFRMRQRAAFKELLGRDPTVQHAISTGVITWAEDDKAAELIPLFGTTGPKDALAEVIRGLGSEGVSRMTVDADTGEIVPAPPGPEGDDPPEDPEEREKGLAEKWWDMSIQGRVYNWWVGE